MVSLRISPNNTYAQKSHDGGGALVERGVDVPRWERRCHCITMLSLSDPDVFTPPINTP